MIEIGWISYEQLSSFRSLLLPDTVIALEHGEPLATLGIMDGSTACGAAAAWIHDETLEIRSLYVAPKYRRRGSGKLLLESLCCFARPSCSTIELSYTHTLPDHDTLPPFLSALGFVQTQSASVLYGVPLKELSKSSFFSGKYSLPPKILPFSKIPSYILTSAYKTTVARGENYLDVPLTHPSVDKDVSIAVMEKNTIRSFAVFTASNQNRIRLAWMRSTCPQDMPLLLHGAFTYLQEKYSPDTVLTMEAITPVSDSLIHSLLPNAKPISRTYIRFLE